MKYAFFIGCNTPIRAPQYEMSVRKICEKLGIELVDIEEFGCCGYPMETITHDGFLLLSARNLAVAEEKGLNILTICNACTAALTRVNKMLKEDDKLRKEVNEKLKKIGKEYKGTIEVNHFARILYEKVGIDKIKEKIVKPLTGIKIASHYGCHYFKPTKVYDRRDDPEVPTTLDKLVEATGAEPIDYNTKLCCCGGPIIGSDENLSMSLANNKLKDVANTDAHALNLVCPFCEIMYGMNQGKMKAQFEESYTVPTIFYPQLLGLAMGYSLKDLGMQLNRVKPVEIMDKFKDGE